MSDSGLDALEAERAVEAKLSEAGADNIRRYSFSEAPEAVNAASAAPEGTPAETVEADQPRNDLGQFASEEQSEMPEAEAPENVVEEVAAENEDDPTRRFLAKYGDPDDPATVQKALAGATHLQRKSGEQSNELGELRQMVAELTQLQHADLQQRQQNQPLDQGTVDWFDEQLMQNPQAAVEYARQQGNNLLFQRGIAQWKELQPYEAAVYTNDLKNAQFRQEMQQQAAAASQLPADANMHMALQNVRAKTPEYVNYDDAIEATLAKYPHRQRAIEAAYQSGDREQLEGEIETLYALAQRDTLHNNALTGNTPENTTASAEVAEPTVSETREPEPEPSKLDVFRQQFRETAEREQKGIWVAE